ncbi:geranylgeranyl diphosphate synthase type I [Allocatelliglobosispora scoriae]|uniref:Geranylgeranyl diphosphate synthase type I n=1 Tax=Allocatelliglobosispora scoriae TaxID=643052 RepID=A0A841C0P8_9ACTN|nr:polyprenyl synthetase family protein [Allocatelliglobosispora scoriae]MBB5872632.1 geranylgeranyl diphosphate synthase type I [Allocatelliglobosispora scoriae]
MSNSTLRASTGLRGQFDDALAAFLDARAADWPDTVPGPLPQLIRRFILAGGKRLRPSFCYWGWSATSRTPEPGLICAAASLELFHSFALIHDDIMDASDLRRGEPTMHRSLARLYAHESEAAAERMGGSLAILAGDLCAMWSEQMFHESGLPAGELAAALPWLVLMRNEIILGQFLDITAADGTTASCEEIIKYKTARYTVTRPLQIGAALAGADRRLITGLAGFGDPLGAAFQLRDDLLGVFGTPTDTGKPDLDDLRAGKPTMLIAIARRRARATQSTRIRDLYGSPGLDESGARTLRAAITDTGAVTAVETMIQRSRR